MVLGWLLAGAVVIGAIAKDNRSEVYHDDGRVRELQQRLAQRKIEQEEELARKRKEIQRLEEKQKKKEEDIAREIAAAAKKNKEEILRMEFSSLEKEAATSKEMVAELTKTHTDLTAEYDSASQQSKNIQQKIAAEEARLFKLKFDDVRDGYVLVLLGKTGAGKSTLSNRLAGDVSKKGDAGPAEVSVPFKSCTTVPEIIRGTSNGKTLFTVDSGGFGDDEGRDCEHINGLCQFLQGCGGINAFLLLINFQENRITPESRLALLAYENVFGKDFYKHMAIIATRVDVGGVAMDDWDDGGDQKLRDVLISSLKLRDKMTDRETKQIPIIPSGVGNYERALQNIHSLLRTDFRNKIGMDKDELQSPLKQLRQRNKKFHKLCEGVKLKVDEYYHNLCMIQMRLQQIENEIANKANQMRSRL